MALDNPNKYINRLKQQFQAAHQELVTQGVHPTHIAYKLINLDAQVNGTYWNKCMDCGQPYVVGEFDGNSNSNFCSLGCQQQTEEYLDITINYTPPNPQPVNPKNPKFNPTV